MIKLEMVSKSFGNKLAVDDVSLEVGRGEIFGFLGPNGAGKTTTIRMITGIAVPTSGKIIVNGADVATDPVRAKSAIGYIPDRPYLYELLTAREFFRFMGGLYNMDPSEAAVKGVDYLRIFEMDEETDSLIEGFSHGMKQKVIMAAALIHEPRIIVVDEPMVGLDPRSAALVKDLFQELAADGVTIFLSTHTLSVVEEICTRVGVIHRGRMLFDGTVEGMKQLARMTDSSLEKVFIELTREGAKNSGITTPLESRVSVAGEPEVMKVPDEPDKKKMEVPR